MAHPQPQYQMFGCFHNSDREIKIEEL